MNLEEETARKQLIEDIKKWIRATNKYETAQQKCRLLDNAAHAASIIEILRKLL